MPATIDRYPVDGNDPMKVFADRIREIERRINELSSARHGGIYNQVVKDSAGNNRITMDAAGIKFYDTAGHLLLQIGELGGGDAGFAIWNETGRPILRSTQNGQEWPFAFIPWSGFPWWAETTDAGYTGQELFRSDFTSTADRIGYDFQADPQGGTMDVRVQVYEYGGTPTTVVNPINANGQYAGSVAIPAACLTSGTDPQGRFMTIRVEAKRTSGASPVRVRLNAPFVNLP